MIYVKVIVFPDFKKELVEKFYEKSNAENRLCYKMYLKQPPERGQANKRVLEILQKDFPGKKIKIVSGHKYMKKVCEIG